ncbi:MAG: phosphoribosyltransferase family protein [Pseudomonadota bacterium]
MKHRQRLADQHGCRECLHPQSVSLFMRNPSRQSEVPVTETTAHQAAADPRQDEKIYISANELLRDSFELGLRVLQDGFRPDFIVAVWRGGTPVGIAVQELLSYCDIQSDHIAIRTSYYHGIDKTHREVQVHNLGYLAENLNHDHSLLIVDDVFDRGRSIQAIMDKLNQLLRRNMPKETRIATVWYKPEKNLTELVPHYYVHETAQWLVFPHELAGLTHQEVAYGKTSIAGIVQSAQKLCREDAAE